MKSARLVPAPNLSEKNRSINSRQLCFFVAFLTPVCKLMEAPSLLAEAALGDLLLPAFLQFLLQSVGLLAILLPLEKTGKGPLCLLEEKLGKGIAKAAYILLAVYYVFSALLPILDLEKFSLVVFFDATPSRFIFTPFFLLSGFVCTKGLRAFGRICDLCLFVFPIAFLGLLVTSAGESDFGALLPWFEFPASRILSAIGKTTLHFSDVAPILFLSSDCEYEKGDGKKIFAAYWTGAAFVLGFLAVFYGIYTTLAPRQHYAFSKISQYFPALKTTGRVDLLFVYLLTMLLTYAYSLPLLLSCKCVEKVTECKGGALVSAILNGGLFLFTLFCNKYYVSLYAFFTEKLWWIFPIFSVAIPLLCLLFLIGEGGKRKKNSKRGKSEHGETAAIRKKENVYAD